MTFRPSLHGWPFAAVPGMAPHVLGIGARAAADDVPGGGLCLAALDRYRRGVRIPRGTAAPEPGDALHAELVRRQVEAVAGVWPRVREWQARPGGSWRDRLPIRVGGGQDLASLSRAEWPPIRARLAHGEPVLLTLVEEADPYQRAHAARQVLATAWTMTDARVLVSIYDPERPGDDDVHLGFGPGGEFEARLTGGHGVRGFFAVPYDRTVPRSIRAETFADRSVIGLNRKVRGRVAASAGAGRIDVVARDADGALLHFRRESGRNWEGANVAERDGLSGVELHSDPVMVRSGSVHVFARSYVGDLLHFQEGRSWSMENRTEHKRAGPRFRMESRPVALTGPWRRINVLGLDRDGGLVHYWGQPIRGWRAEQVAGDPLAGPPCAAWSGDTLHVVGVSRTGGLVHWTWDGSGWALVNVGTPGAERSPLMDDGAVEALCGRPSLRIDAEHNVHIAARTLQDRLMGLRWSQGGSWAARELATGVAGDPILTDGPAGVHLFARTAAGDVLHGWRTIAGTWAVEELLASRAVLPPLPRTENLSAWGSADELRVWVRAERDLWTLTWRPDADWSLERLTERAGVAERHRPGEDPVVASGYPGEPHLFLTDGRGTVVHVESGRWRAPADDEPSITAPRAASSWNPAAGPAAAQVDAPEGAEEAGEAPPATESDSELPFLDFEADPPPSEEAQAPATAEVEPMDLSLLNTWPPPPPSMRRRSKQKEAGPSREAGANGQAEADEEVAEREAGGEAKAQKEAS